MIEREQNSSMLHNNGDM